MRIGERLGAPTDGILNFTVNRAAAAGGALSNGMQRAVERRAELLHAASLAKKKAKPTVPWTAVTVEGERILSDFGFAKGTTVKQIRERIGRRLRAMGMMGAGEVTTLPRVYVESAAKGKVLPDSDFQTLESLVKLHDLAAFNRQGRIAGRCGVVQFRVVVLPAAASAEEAEEIFAKQMEEMGVVTRRQAELTAKTTVRIVDGDDHEDHLPPPALKPLFTTAERVASDGTNRDDDEEDMPPPLLRRAGGAAPAPGSPPGSFAPPTRHVPSNGTSSGPPLGSVPEDAERSFPTKKLLDLPEIPRLTAVENFHRPWLQAFQAIGAQSSLPASVRKASEAAAAAAWGSGGYHGGGPATLGRIPSAPPALRMHKTAPPCSRTMSSCPTGGYDYDEEDYEDEDLLPPMPTMLGPTPSCPVARRVKTDGPSSYSYSCSSLDPEDYDEEEEEDYGGYPACPPAALGPMRTCPSRS